MSSSIPACRTISVRCFSSWLLSRRDGKRWCCAWAGGDKLKWSDTVCGQKNVGQKWAKQHVITCQILGLYARCIPNMPSKQPPISSSAHIAPWRYQQDLAPLSRLMGSAKKFMTENKTKRTTSSVKHDLMTFLIWLWCNLQAWAQNNMFIFSGCWPWHITFPMLHELRHLRDLFQLPNMAVAQGLDGIEM